MVRPVRDADLGDILAWRNQPHVRAGMFTQHEIAPDEHHSWFERSTNNVARRLLIVERAGIPLGFVNFDGVEAGGIATWGFYAAVGAPGGSGSVMGAAALSFIFSDTALHKVCGQVLGFNHASLRMHEKLGFRQEGLLRQQHRMGDTYHDIICFGLLREEWAGN
ncbi:UDP-4-amino-4,6-dideoxy-N-acetyl-beta-L-altrosamine N-acetyltransferase [Herbaspirillum chlorophenolicum]|uniref:UDP-4-amino-4, 6-dideoxy-N-acetyl-beta-L-altrosamine N-acetyltransferase n=1 Tax=Herbaspirillum chlorophenolicum TaxID=211589 RepID=A0ABW8EVE2_9BURK